MLACYLGFTLTICCSEKNSEEKRGNMKSKVEIERNNYNVADEKMSGTVCSIWDQTTVKISFMRVNAAAVITHFFHDSKNICLN